jgi:hypothetical protein
VILRLPQASPCYRKRFLGYRRRRAVAVVGTAVIIEHAHADNTSTMQRDATSTAPPPTAPAIVNSAKSTNKLLPNTAAGGDHSTFKIDKSGKITGTATFETNTKNPTGFQLKKRVDVTGSAHYDKQTGKLIETPHVHEGDSTRPAEPSDLPQQQTMQQDATSTAPPTQQPAIKQPPK